MPIELKLASNLVTGPCKAPSISPLLIAATLALAILHLVIGVMFSHSHASPAIGAPAIAALDDSTTCSAGVDKPETSLPYD